MKVSIIIPTIHANDTLLDECLLAVNYTAPKAELIVADDPVPFAANCNRGALRASGDILIFLNDDTIPGPEWLAPLLDAFSSPSVAIAGSCLRYPTTLALQHAGIYFTNPDGILTANNVTDEAMNYTRDVDAVTGACMAIRADVFSGYAGFDDGFRSGYEDVDFCLRVRADGWRIRYVAESVVLHHESASGPERWRYVQENIQRLQELWNVREEVVDPETIPGEVL